MMGPPGCPLGTQVGGTTVTTVLDALDFWRNSGRNAAPLILANWLNYLVGVRGFEPPAPASRIRSWLLTDCFKLRIRRRLRTAFSAVPNDARLNPAKVPQRNHGLAPFLWTANGLGAGAAALGIQRDRPFGFTLRTGRHGRERDFLRIDLKGRRAAAVRSIAVIALDLSF
jgi:hypothetical protein